MIKISFFLTGDNFLYKNHIVSTNNHKVNTDIDTRVNLFNKLCIVVY